MYVFFNLDFQTSKYAFGTLSHHFGKRKQVQIVQIDFNPIIIINNCN